MSARHIFLALSILTLCLLRGTAQDFRAYRKEVEGGYPYWFYNPEQGETPPPEAHHPLVIFHHGSSLCGWGGTREVT